MFHINSSLVSFEKRNRKRIIRDYLFLKCNQFKIITMLGNSPKEAIDNISKFKEIVSYEINPEVYKKQINYLNDSYNLILGDIISHPVRKTVLYDLDFCCTIDKVREHIKRFKNCDFLLTVSIRKISIDTTIKIFMNEIGENYSVVKTKGRYIILSNRIFSLITYKDTSPMCIITNLI